MYNLEKSLSWGVTEPPVICNACRRRRLILLARTLVNTRRMNLHESHPSETPRAGLSRLGDVQPQTVIRSYRSSSPRAALAWAWWDLVSWFLASTKCSRSAGTARLLCMTTSGFVLGVVGRASVDARGAAVD